MIGAKPPLELRAPAKPPKRAGTSGGARAARARSAAAAAAPNRSPAVADAVRIVGWLSIAAGAIHAIAMVDHFSHWWLYGAFFMALTYGQVLWGVALLRKPATDRNLSLGAYASLAIVGVWLFSRTIGMPTGPEDGRPEPVGLMDVAAQVDQLVLAVYVIAIVRPELRTVAGIRTLLGAHRVRIGMMLCSSSAFLALLGGGHSH